MNKIKFPDSGQPFSLSWQTLDFMQSGIQDGLYGIASAIAGYNDTCILSGVVLNNNSVSGGYIVFNGELLTFNPGPYNDTVSVVQTVGARNDEIVRYAVCGDNVPGFVSTFPFSDLKPPMDWLIPKGMIMMWSGSVHSIPSGWHFCDGSTQNGIVTPNLSDKFVVGVSFDYKPSPNSPYYPLTTIEGPSSFRLEGGNQNYGNVHLEKRNIPPHVHTSWRLFDDPNSTVAPGNILSVSPSNTGDGSADGLNGDPFSILPPYYALAYIMKV